jgi:hypothetical protein
LRRVLATLTSFSPIVCRSLLERVSLESLWLLASAWISQHFLPGPVSLERLWLGLV